MVAVTVVAGQGGLAHTEGWMGALEDEFLEKVLLPS